MALALRNTDAAGAALKDIRVRQALNYAVDKEAIAKRYPARLRRGHGTGRHSGVLRATTPTSNRTRTMWPRRKRYLPKRVMQKV